MGHDLTGIIAEVSGPALDGARAPFCLPLVSGGAELVVEAQAGCRGCARAQESGHWSCGRWRLEDGSGGRYSGASPWAVSPGAEWVRPAQGWLWWVSKWVAGYPTVPMIDGFGDGVNDSLATVGVSYGLVSCEGGVMTLTRRDADPEAGRSDPDPDPRSCFAGAPLMAGDCVLIEGNNCAADGRVRPIARSVSLTGCNMERPWLGWSGTEIVLEITPDPGDAMYQALDEEEPWSCTVRICRETAEQPWIDARADTGDYIWCVAASRSYTEADIPWSGWVALEWEGARVALPQEGREVWRRLMTIEVSRDGVVEDVTESMAGLYNFSVGGILRRNGAGVTSINLRALTEAGDLDWVRVSYWREASVTSAGAVIAGVGRCRHCVTDESGTWGVEGSDGRRWVCALASEASGIGEFGARCFLPGRCDRFEVLEESEFLDGRGMYAAFRQIWQGGYPVTYRQTGKIGNYPPEITWWYDRAGVASIEGMVRRLSLGVINAGEDDRHVVEGGMFGYLEEGRRTLVHGVGFDEEDEDLSLPDGVPGEGALLRLVGLDDGRSLIEHSDLDNDDDPTYEHRRQPGVMAWQRSADFGGDVGTDGPRLTQGPGSGIAGAEEVLLPGIGLEAGYYDRSAGSVRIGWMDSEFVGTDRAGSTWGALLRVRPGAGASVADGPILWGGAPIDGVIAAVDGGTPSIDVYPSREVFMRWYFAYGPSGPGYYAAQGEAGIDGIPFFFGGHFSGRPEYMRVRNSGCSARAGHAGEMVGARRGWGVVFLDGSGDPLATVPGWPDEARAYMIARSEPFGGAPCMWQGKAGAAALIEDESDQAASDDYYANGGGHLYSLAASESEGLLPVDFSGWGNRCDRITLWDDFGSDVFDSGSVEAGATARLVKGLSFAPGMFACSLASASVWWCLYGRSEWTQIPGAQWGILDDVGGVIGVRSEAVDLIAASGRPVCFRVVCPGGRLGSVSWVGE